MADNTAARTSGYVSGRSNDIILALTVVGMTMLLILPLTPLLLDILIAISIVLSVTILLVTLYTDESISFSSFPSMLLILTLFRLGLNIASTRMILTQAQAGEIIKTFGSFVTGGNELVGFLIFLVLTGVNFVVITKGSGRVAEVAARFNLDALPGKQMAIDADLNSGIISEEEAQRRREKVLAESDFYGAMDGASKFVRGDAIAGIFIVAIILIGSFIVGMIMRGLSWSEVVRIYVTLAIGDGLVTQIPALLVSVAAGIIVTRSSSRQRLGEQFQKQMFNNPKVLGTTALILFLLSLVPGMPKLVMWTIAAIIFFYSRALVPTKPKAGAAPVFELAGGDALELGEQAPGKDVEKALFIDPMEIEFGEKLAPLVNEGNGASLLSRIGSIRRQTASDIGIVVPPIRIHEDKSLPPDTYVIKIKGNEVESSILYLDHYLAVNPGHINRKITGIPAIEPAFKLPATWITPEERENAEAIGFALADPLSVLTTHLTEIIHVHAHELLNRQEVARLVENARMHAPAVVNELIPARLSLGDILKVLQNLLRERISIRDIVSILEILADNTAATKDTDVLTEYVRIGMARSISKQYMDQNKTIHALTFDPKVEQMMLESIQKNEYGRHIVLHPGTTQIIIGVIKEYVSAAGAQGFHPVLITSSALRPYVKKFIERSLPNLAVLAFSEIVREVQISNLGTVSQDVLMQ